MSPSPSYGSANMFAQPSVRNVAKSSLGSSTRTIEPQQILDPLNTDASSFFDFEPHSGTQSPYQQFSTPGASSMPWGNDVNFHPISPPDSAAFTPKNWPYNSFSQPNPSSLLTNIDPVNSRAQYGQVTPPDDDVDKENILAQYQAQRMQPSGSEKKRKRSSLHSNENSPTKRSRKYASRVSQSVEINKPEDVKRSKFLERNRVAASKCRQKKKEWTQNLESRARELQKTNSSVRMIIESLRQETLFLKGEMLKHHSCGCDQIQEFIKSGIHNIDQSNDEMIFKREHSPIESMPRSRSGSVGATSQHAFEDFDRASPDAQQNISVIASDEYALEALLSSSINHDTSDEAIASVIAR